MSDDVVVRSYATGDEKSIVPLLKLGFEEWRQRSDGAYDYWRWMYLDNPSESSIVYVGVSGEDVVATNHTITLNIKILDKIVKCSYGTDVMVHPDYRRRGIYSRVRDQSVIEEKNRGNKYAYLYTTNPIVIENYKKKNIDAMPKLFPHAIKRYLRIKNVDLHLRMKPSNMDWLLSLGYQVFSLTRKITGIISRPSKAASEDMRVRRINVFDEGIDRFWETIADQYLFILARDRVFLNWRFCDPRIGPYEIILAEDDSGTLGYVVLHIMEKVENYPEGYIVDLLTLPGRIDVTNRLVAEAVEYFDSLGINSIHGLTVGRHPLESVLGSHGFVDSRKPVHVIFLTYGGGNDIDHLKSAPADKIQFSYSDMFLL